MPSAVKTSRRVRTLGAGLALAASALLVTTGCGTDSVAETLKEAVQTPQQKLIDATVTPSSEPYAFTVVQKGDPADAEDSSGAVNPPGKGFELKSVQKDEEVGYTLTMEIRVVEQKAWVKMNLEGGEGLGLPELPKKWMAIDSSRLKSQDRPLVYQSQDEDPARLNALFTSIVDAKEDSTGKFSGTLNLAEQPKADIFAATTVKALGEKAKALPFTATITDGKVTEFVLSAPATSTTKAQTYTMTYHDFGLATPVTAPPAAEVTEAPDSVYEILNG